MQKIENCDIQKIDMQQKYVSHMETFLKFEQLKSSLLFYSVIWDNRKDKNLKCQLCKMCEQMNHGNFCQEC